MLFILLYYIILCAYKISEILNINTLNRIKSNRKKCKTISMNTYIIYYLELKYIN